MSRTRRKEPSSPGWYKRPNHVRAAKQAEEIHEELGPGVRADIPPDAWQDKHISYWRGQDWARRTTGKEKPP